MPDPEAAVGTADTAAPSPAAAPPIVVHPARALLATKLARIMRVVTNIPKNGYNEHFKYKFATEADVSAALQQEFAAANLAVLPGVTATRREGNLTIIDMSFLIIDGDTGYAESIPWSGNGEDKNDKGLWKAVTGGVKYWLLKLFLVPTGDDPEATDGEGRRTNRPLRKKAPEAPADNAARNPQDATRITDAEAKRLQQMVKNHGVEPAKFVAALKQHFRYNATAEIEKKHYDRICRAITEGTGLEVAARDAGLVLPA